jgi:hypothetical protein
MTLISKINLLATRIATEFKSVKSILSGNTSGDISGLSTQTKTNIVSAINEIVGSVAGVQTKASYLFVDYNSPYQGLPEKNNMAKPYLTLGAAIQNSSANEIIYVVSGVHMIEEGVSFTNNHQIYLFVETGGVLVKTVGGSNNFLLDFNNKNVVVIGRGTFINMDSGECIKGGQSAKILQFNTIKSTSSSALADIKHIEDGYSIICENENGNAISVVSSIEGGIHIENIRSIGSISQPNGVAISISDENNTTIKNCNISTNGIGFVKNGNIGKTFLKDINVFNIHKKQSFAVYGLVLSENTRLLNVNVVMGAGADGGILIKDNTIIENIQIDSDDSPCIVVDLPRTHQEIPHNINILGNVILKSTNINISTNVGVRISNNGVILYDTQDAVEQTEEFVISIQNPQVDDIYEITDGTEVVTFAVSDANLVTVLTGITSNLNSASGSFALYSWVNSGTEIYGVCDNPINNSKDKDLFSVFVTNGVSGITDQEINMIFLYGAGHNMIGVGTMSQSDTPDLHHLYHI